MPSFEKPSNAANIWRRRFGTGALVVLGAGNQQLCRHGLRSHSAGHCCHQAANGDSTSRPRSFHSSRRDIVTQKPAGFACLKEETKSKILATWSANAKIVDPTRQRHMHISRRHRSRFATDSMRVILVALLVSNATFSRPLDNGVPWCVVGERWGLFCGAARLVPRIEVVDVVDHISARHVLIACVPRTHHPSSAVLFFSAMNQQSTTRHDVTRHDTTRHNTTKQQPHKHKARARAWDRRRTREVGRSPLVCLLSAAASSTQTKQLND